MARPHDSEHTVRNTYEFSESTPLTARLCECVHAACVGVGVCVCVCVCVCVWAWPVSASIPLDPDPWEPARKRGQARQRLVRSPAD